jgi:hypothetical protein
MLLYEYRLEAFNARGNDEHIDEFARRLDELLDLGWTLLDSSREIALAGWWRVELFKEKVSGLEKTPAGI